MDERDDPVIRETNSRRILECVVSDDSVSRQRSVTSAQKYVADRSQTGCILRNTAATSAGPYSSSTSAAQLGLPQSQHEQRDILGGGSYDQAGFTAHAAGVMRLLQGMWETRHMCDMVINVNGQSLPVHRLALAACSETFKAKLCSQQPNDIKELHVTNTTVEATELVLRYMYTLELSLDEEIVDTVISCALQLGISTVVEACKSFLLQFNLDNAMKFIEISEKHQLLDVLSQIHGFICVHFQDIATSSEFLEYDPDTLCRLLADDSLVVSSELVVFLAVQRWIEHNVEERLVYAADLMKLVRMVLISPEDIALHVETCQYIFQIPECHEMLYSALRYHALKYSDSYLADTFQVPKSRRIKAGTQQGRSTETQVQAKNENKSSNCAYEIRDMSNNNAPTPDLITSPASTILTVGGLNPAEVCANQVSRWITEYNPKSNSWAALASLPDKRHHQAATLLDKELYIIGGSSVDKADSGITTHQNATSTCYKFDLASHSWSQVAPMRCKRVYHSVVTLDGQIYVIGGQDERGKSLASMECYNPSTNTWKMFPPMPEAKTGATSVVFRNNIFVIGGFRETPMSKTPLANVEYYDPRRKVWSAKRPFPVPCSHASAVVASGSLFVMGGATFDHSNGPISSMSSIYLYVPESDRWRFFTNLHVPRHSAAAASIGNHIYVMGGLSTMNNLVLSTVECLDIGKGSWVTDIKDLPHPALGLCACVDLQPEDVQLTD